MRLVLIYPCDPDTQITMSMHDDTLDRLVKDVLNTRADVVEQSDRVAQEVGGTKYSVDLGDELFSIMQDDALLQRRHRQSSVVDDQCVKPNWRSVDVS